MWGLIATVAGAFISSSANKKAAQTAAAAEYERQRLAREAEERARAEMDRRTAEANEAIRVANEQSQQAYAQVQEANAPGQTYLRQLVADPGSLTPQQTAQLEELRRATANQLRGSQFAGSGRTARTLFRAAESDFTNEALEKNRQRSVDAAGVMAGRANQAEMQGAGQTMQAGNSVANLTAGLGNNTANLITNTAKVSGDSVAKAGLYDAQAEAANGKIYGQAVGDIGSIIANQSRESRYSDRLSKVEKQLGL